MARGAERYRHLAARGGAEQPRHLFLSLGYDHNLWDHAVESGVGTPGQGAQLVGENPLFGYEFPDVGQEFVMSG